MSHPGSEAPLRRNPGGGSPFRQGGEDTGCRARDGLGEWERRTEKIMFVVGII